MSNPKMAEVTLVDGGGIFTDDDGQTHFIKGYGSGRGKLELDLDPRIDLLAPICEQVLKLREQDAAAEDKA
jgi:hypothetical protein